MNLWTRSRAKRASPDVVGGSGVDDVQIAGRDGSALEDASEHADDYRFDVLGGEQAQDLIEASLCH